MFGHPDQHEHKVRGIKAALKSSKTPPHLKPHLKRQLEMNMKKQTSSKPMTGGMVPAKKMQVNRMGAPDDPAQQKKEPPLAFRKKFKKGSVGGKNKGKMKVQGKGTMQRNPILGTFPGLGDGPDDDGY